MAILASLPRLDRRVDFEGREDLVTHSIIVECQGKVTLDLDAFHLADKGYPLEKCTSLQTQESEDRRIELVLTLQLLALCHSLEVSEPTPLDHQSLDLLGLFLLITGSCI